MESLALLAFFHDIGKFRQRYELEVFQKSTKIEECYKYFLKKIGFFTENEDLINSVFEKEMPNDEKKALLWVSDKIAKKSLITEDENYEISSNILYTPLKHIFNENKFFDIAKLSVKNIFPKDSISGNYKKLWEEFENDLEKINYVFKNVRGIEHIKIKAFEYLLKKYTSLIPHRLDKESDSLYEHLKMSAMLADVIDSMRDKENFFKEIRDEKFDNNRFLLIVGDFFGIQNFIFEEVKTKYASKILRAKSAYIQILVKVLSFYITENLGLSHYSIISTHAGKFEILAPNEKRVIDKLTKIQEELNEFFLERFFGETGVGIAYAEVSVTDFVNERDYKDLRKKLADKIDEMKFKKFNLHKLKEKIFDYDEGIDNQNLCEFCNKRKGNKKEKYTICEICNAYVKIGKNLVDNKFLAVSKKAKDDGDIEIFKGYYIHFFNTPSNSKLKDDVAVYDIVTDEEFRGYEKWELSSYVALRDDFKDFEDYLKTKALSETNILTFEELAALSVRNEIHNSEREKGVEALMALKGDVDGMGNFIQTSTVTDSFVKFNFFSKIVDYYFSVYIPVFLMRQKPFYTVFSGGDDLFVLGAWDEVIDLAKNVRNGFKKFTGGNLSFSTGLVMSKSNKPVNFLAETAESKLEAAKEFCCEKMVKGCYETEECDENKHIKKDAVNIFSYTINWDVYQEVRKEVLEWFGDYEKTHEVKTSVLYRLLELTDMRLSLINTDTQINNELLKNSLWKSKLSYFYRRNVSEGEVSFLKKLNDWIEETPKEFKVSLFEYIYKKRSR